MKWYKMKTKYECIEDRQGGDFAVGVIANANEWRNIARSWADNDNWSNAKTLLKNATEQEIINFIDDMWEITLVKYEGE